MSIGETYKRVSDLIDRIDGLILDSEETLMVYDEDEIGVEQIDDLLDTVAAIHKDFYGYTDEYIMEAVSDLVGIENTVVRDHYFDPKGSVNLIIRRAVEISEELSNYLCDLMD
jgi:hypothetical protein